MEPDSQQGIAALRHRAQRWWKPNATLSKPDESGNVFLPPLTVSTATVWQLAERMADAMSAPVLVLVADGSPNTYRAIGSEAELARLGRVDGVRLVAGGGISLEGGSLSSDGSVGMNFDFPAGRAGNASLFGGMDEIVPHHAQLTELLAWFTSLGQYRWGWLPALRIGGPLLIALVLAGLVAAVLAALDGPAAWLSVPFVIVTSLATAWGLAIGTRRAVERERARVRAVQVRPSR